jgi:hypothetical protein
VLHGIELAAFVSNYIVQAGQSRLTDGMSIILAGGFEDGEMVKLVQASQVLPVPTLFSSHEEADTRMVLHGIELAKNHSRLIFQCDDTDVMVLLTYYTSKGMLGSNVQMLVGHSGKQRYVSINQVSDNLGADICQSLPACHALTGCDSTSSLYKIGKVKAFNKLEKMSGDLKELKNLGLSDSVDESVAHKYVMSLYGIKMDCNGKPCETLDQLRFVMASTTDTSASALPPTEDSFQQHLLRANYQTAVWVHSHLPKPMLWSPVGHGWKLDEQNILEPVMSRKDIALQDVRELTHLYCKCKECKANKCQCLAVGLQCTEFCDCDFDSCSNVTHIISLDD